MKIIKTICIGVTAALSSLPTFAQQTYEELEQLTVNEQVTTVITASEPIRFVDISTDKVVGDQPINNTIRLKPKETGTRTVRYWPSSPLSRNAIVPSMRCSIPQGCRKP